MEYKLFIQADDSLRVADIVFNGVNVGNEDEVEISDNGLRIESDME